MPLSKQGLTDSVGHVASSGTGLPTLSAVNANISSPTVAGNDTRGSISFAVITGTIAAGTLVFHLDFAVAYATAPIVLVNNGSNVTTSSWYTSVITTTGCNIINGAGVPVAAGYKVNYLVIG